MKINFTKKEYYLLVTMLEISDWIMTSHETGENEDKKPYKEMRQKVLSFCKEMGMEDSYVKEGDEYYATAEQENSTLEFIEEYNEHFFWDELIAKLAERDFQQKYQNQQVDMTTRIEAFTAFQNIYAKEINQNGLLNFMIANKRTLTLH